MNSQFEQLLERRGNGSMKWERSYIKKRFGIDRDDDIYPLFIADMDYCMDEEIYQKMKDWLTQPDFGYFHIQESYYESIIQWQKKVHHMDVNRTDIIASLGTVTSMNIACDIYAQEKGIAMLTPVYGSFAKCAGVGTCVMIPLALVAGRYELDLQAIEQAFITENVKVLLFCNPHNPSGRVWSRDELEAIVELCRAYHVVLLSDEIHSDLNLGEQPFVSLLEISREEDWIMVSTSPNKTFNLSGLTTSYILCKNQQMREAFQAYLDRLHLSCNRMGIMMSELVYRYGYTWLQQLTKQIQSNIRIVEVAMQQLPVQVMKPESGYLVWIYLPEIKDIDAFILALAKQTHVLIESGSRFVDHYDSWIRINVATSASLLQEAMNRLVAFYQKRD